MNKQQDIEIHRLLRYTIICFTILGVVFLWIAGGLIGEAIRHGVSLYTAGTFLVLGILVVLVGLFLAFRMVVIMQSKVRK